ncbi:MAG: glycosyltransferase family 2 protein [Gammaproteobacteria bacterium]|jgi:cellulose synthase/poly-beta-1,6-N-acetylglucosamine synthase-like glycosyltransferase
MKVFLSQFLVVLLLMSGGNMCLAGVQQAAPPTGMSQPGPHTGLDPAQMTFPPASFAFFFQTNQPRPWYIVLMLGALLTIVAIIIVYSIRHYRFTLNRLFARQRHPYLDIDVADWPTVTVAVPAHNEELVIRNIINALLEVDYPADRLQILPMNDRSTDRTGEILDELAQQYPDRIRVLHRKDGTPGKAAALKEATKLVQSEILLVFDADYIPGVGLIKQLVSPFFDPEIGAMMGRVVPLNVNKNLLTRLLDLERSGGYQVDQQARMNLHLVPQYGGTVGGVRMSALESVGGWDEKTLAEDTEMTYRMLMAGWKTAYQNRSECYEEVPETWFSRIRQLKRWARGHNHVTRRYTLALLRSRRVSLREKIDGLLLLGVYAMSLVIVVGWALAITLFFLGEQMTYGVIAILAVTSYGALGNFAAYFEISAALRLDGRRQAISLLSINMFNFLVSLVATTRGSFSLLVPRKTKSKSFWDKTERFRRHKADAS